MDHAEIVRLIVLVIELIAVAILATGTAWVLGRGVVQRLRGLPWERTYEGLRGGLGRVLLLGLEVLIAADIIATVTLDLTVQSVGALGLIVLIRTFLSWAIEVEAEGLWPWQRASHHANGGTDGNGRSARPAGHAGHESE